MKPLYDWCEAHGALLTGHMVLEEGLTAQVTSNGAVMPHYEFLHMPGMDWLTRRIEPPNTPHQVASVANQLGRRRVLSESFAGCGWSVTFEELEMDLRVADGPRGDDSLPAPGIFPAGPAQARLAGRRSITSSPGGRTYRVQRRGLPVGALLAEGEVAYEVLVVHPQSSAWLRYDDAENLGLAELNEAFLEPHPSRAPTCSFHYGDERILRATAASRVGLCVGARPTAPSWCPVRLRWPRAPCGCSPSIPAGGTLVGRPAAGYRRGRAGGSARGAGRPRVADRPGRSRRSPTCAPSPWRMARAPRSPTSPWPGGRSPSAWRGRAAAFTYFPTRLRTAPTPRRSRSPAPRWPGWGSRTGRSRPSPRRAKAGG